MKNEGISKTIKSIYPYVVIAALASLYTVFRIKKGSKNYLVTRETIDSNGIDKVYNEYDNSYAIDSGKITHITRWNLNENNEYERTTKIYDINSLKPEVAKNIVENDKTIYSLDEMFGEAILTEKEIGKNLTEEELNKPDFLEAVTYSKDYDKYVVTKLSTMELVEDVALSFTYFVIGTLIFGGIRIAKDMDYNKIANKELSKKRTLK